MTTAYDIPAEKLIASIAEELKKNDTIKPPEWSNLVKTGIHREKAPGEPDWWYTRVAAILRKVYIYGPIGTEKLSAQFGGPVDKGSKPSHAWSGSRSIIRLSLQQLELSGLIQPYKKRGRVISPQGQKLLDNASYAIFKELAKEQPKLTKYGK
ncbi:MAG: 30S ribosomal protein S19e [Thermoplasmata archaeon]